MTRLTEPPVILFVDDDDGIVEVVETLLREEGYVACCVRSTDEALAFLTERQPALILLDLTTPGMPVDDFVEAQRRLSQNSAPVVLVSGRHDVAEVAERIGAFSALAKPFDLIVMLDIVEEALGSRSQCISSS